MAGLTVYWFELKASTAQRAAWRAWLSPEERACTDRYLNPVHGDHYLAAHAQLRWVLGQRLGCLPGSLRFERESSGKPRLAGHGLQFNLSHSGTLGLLGVHPSLPLGVDIEAERPRDFLGLAQRYFTASEQAWLAAQPESRRGHAFARLWTCKEAWMKADGRGLEVLRQPEAQFEGGAAQLRALGRRWWVRELATTPGYAAAVVLPEAPGGLTVRPLPPPPLA